MNLWYLNNNMWLTYAVHNALWILFDFNNSRQRLDRSFLLSYFPSLQAVSAPKPGIYQYLIRRPSTLKVRFERHYIIVSYGYKRTHTPENSLKMISGLYYWSSLGAKVLEPYVSRYSPAFVSLIKKNGTRFWWLFS